LAFKYRIHDPEIGRWLSVDPLQKKYPYASPYSFALNTPIQAVDPDGREVIPAGKEEVVFLKGLVNDLFGKKSGFKVKRSGIKVNKRRIDKAGYTGDMKILADRLVEVSTNTKHKAKFVLGSSASVSNTVGYNTMEVPNYIDITNADGTKSRTIDPNNPTKIEKTPKSYTNTFSNIEGGFTTEITKDNKLLKNQIVIVNPADEGKPLLEDNSGAPLGLEGRSTAVHELLGHFFDNITGSNNDTAVDTENKARKKFKLKQRSGVKH
jgi:uncharacterized protein RhaS with RHS repeats